MWLIWGLPPFLCLVRGGDRCVWTENVITSAAPWIYSRMSASRLMFCGLVIARNSNPKNVPGSRATTDKDVSAGFLKKIDFMFYLFFISSHYGDDWVTALCTFTSMERERRSERVASPSGAVGLLVGSCNNVSRAPRFPVWGRDARPPPSGSLRKKHKVTSEEIVFVAK